MSTGQVLFEEAGDFKAGTVLSEAGASLQVELASGRRVKVKNTHVVLRFDSPPAADLIPRAERAADELDIDFLWQCAPQDEFAFTDLAADYFGDKPDALQLAALLLKLHASPIHFQRKGRGRYRPAAEESVRTALASLARRRELEARIEVLADQLVAGELPAEIASQAAKLLVSPDKMSLEWRALDLALRRTQLTPERLLLALGAFESPQALHFSRFAAEHFPSGPTFSQALEGISHSVPSAESLPLAEVEAFSIDDETTTEIDDALSVQPLPGGGWRIGIHIAAPAVGLEHESDFDLIARQRMSSVYMPGDKITMLPGSVVACYSLDAGRPVPALSIYLDMGAEGASLTVAHSRLERVPIAANLRHELHSEQATEQALSDETLAAQLPFGKALQVLWRATLASVAERERVRGKPEPRFRADFSFRIDRTADGGERIRIESRRRDAPLDRIVAEMMILANSHWGALLAEHGVPGVYRSQQAGRVRMSTQPLPHEGLGVEQYIWATSPLRRYVDLVNQRQIVAALSNQRPPLGQKDAAMFSIISAFDARHAAYQEFQQKMERLWCLRWLQQERIKRTEAVVVREDVVRLAQAPYYFRLVGLPSLASGQRIIVDVDEVDLIDLSLQARFVGLSGRSDVDDAEGEVAETAQSEPAK
jgi:exoribonuclease-2